MEAHSLNILVAEINLSREENTRNAFIQSDFNCQLFFSTNNAEQLKKVESANVDLVFIHAAIPENQYRQLLNKAKDKSIPVIFITEMPDNIFATKIIKEGATECVSRLLLIPDVLSLIIRQTQHQKQIESALDKLINEKTETAELHFLTEISHLIRTPLHSIIGFSNALLEIDRPEKEKEFLQAIKSSGEKIKKLMDDKLGDEPDSINNEAENFNQPLNRIHFNEIIKLKILLVEDDLLNIKLVEHIFSEYGMKADIALNGKHAIEQLKAKQYDLLLMDIEMPEMNGYETTSFIREKLKNNVPIIAITAHAMTGEREKCIQIGMNDYITKPIEAIQLFEIIYHTVTPSVSRQNNGLSQVTNFQYLKETMNGKKEAIKEMLAYMLQQLPIYLSDLNSAVEKTEYSSIAKNAHKIKSAAFIMGAIKLEPILDEMETRGKNEHGIDKIKSLHLELNNFCQKALEEIKEEKLKFK